MGRPAWVLDDALALPPLSFSDARLPGFSPPGDGGWLRDGPDAPAQREERQRLIAAHPQEVVSVPSSAQAAAQELHSLVVGAACQPFDALVWAHQLSEVAAEDWVLMLPDAQAKSWTLGGAALCFPAHWRLREKLGGSLTRIHAPVPHYDAELDRRVARVLTRMRPDSPGLERANWGLTTTPALFTPQAQGSQGETGEIYLRVERQTLRKLPRSGAVAFGIRTMILPLHALPEPAVVDLHRGLAEMPAAVQAYKMGVSLATRARAALMHGIRQTTASR